MCVQSFSYLCFDFSSSQKSILCEKKMLKYEFLILLLWITSFIDEFIYVSAAIFCWIFFTSSHNLVMKVDLFSFFFCVDD